MSDNLPTCVFDLVNAGPRDLVIVLEPEGVEFVVPCGESVQVHFFGHISPAALKQSWNSEGCCRIAFWPDNGAYDLYFKGKRIWNLL